MVDCNTGRRLEPKDRPWRSSFSFFHPGRSSLLSTAHMAGSGHPALTLPLIRIRSFHFHQSVFSYSSVPSREKGSPISVTSLTLLDMGHSPKSLTAKLPCRIPGLICGCFFVFLKTSAKSQEERCTARLF